LSASAFSVVDMLKVSAGFSTSSLKVEGALEPNKEFPVVPKFVFSSGFVSSLKLVGALEPNKEFPVVPKLENSSVFLATLKLVGALEPNKEFPVPKPPKLKPVFEEGSGADMDDDNPANTLAVFDF